MNKIVLNNGMSRAMLQKLLLFLFLLSLVLLVNFLVISYDMMYFEQPILYIVNQSIHNWHDLLAIYLHPKVLDTNYVPFFRPSGHFLLYQLVTPFLGWHNTRGLLIVNFIFLTLMGYVMIQLYKLLFPRYQTGGYIAFAICLMHPVFLLSRFSPMHFEYASIFFLLLSLYCFIVYLNKNTLPNASALFIPLKHNGWLGATLLFYLIATTFKETTLMLAPALIAYLIIAQGWRINKEKTQLILLVVTVAASLAGYFSLAWLNEGRPPVTVITPKVVLDGLNVFFQTLFSYPFNVIPGSIARTEFSLWGLAVFPLIGSMVMLLSMFLLPITLLYLVRHPASASLSQAKKSTLFLSLCVGIFLLLPILWAHQMPWHAGISLVFLSLLIGFSFELLFARTSTSRQIQQALGFGVAFIVALITVQTNQLKIDFLEKVPDARYMRIDRNAVFSPPNLAAEFNKESVLVVENSMIRNSDYMLGDSVYPFAYLGIYDEHRLRKNFAAYRYPYVYGGTLFRWAYLNTALKEQVYPFRVNQMDRIVDDEVIYNWLQHYDSIFCVGFDTEGHWYDKTDSFKKNLLVEKFHRHLVIHHYQVWSHAALMGIQYNVVKLKAPDSMLCKQICDGDKSCNGFTYYNVEKNSDVNTVCKFYQTIASNKSVCQNCTGFLKELV